MPTLIDSHCHLDFPVFDTDRIDILLKAQAAGIVAIIMPGTVERSWAKLVRLAASHSSLYPALGLHPLFTPCHQRSHLPALEAMLSHAKPIAIGEIGLDAQHAEADHFSQQYYFKAQLAIAKSAQLPVILHVRKCHDVVLQHLRKVRLERGGIVHAFNGSEVQAKVYSDLGFKLGFGGAMTYPRALKLQRLARDLPLTSIVLETDSPDLRPVFETSEHNSPLNLVRICELLAQLRGLAPSELARATSANVCEVLRLTLP